MEQSERRETNFAVRAGHTCARKELPRCFTTDIRIIFRVFHQPRIVDATSTHRLTATAPPKQAR